MLFNGTGFNTQPPEGGWYFVNSMSDLFHEFQHTAARRRLEKQIKLKDRIIRVSTHSRPKAAGTTTREDMTLKVFQHTAARRRLAVS